jgi:hypothetical protein
MLAAVACALYAAPVFDAGWYYDDWRLFAAMQDAGGSWWWELLAACQDKEPVGRIAGCVYHATTYMVLGDHVKLYHVLSIVLLTISSGLLYLLLVRCRLPWIAALAVALVWIVYPGSDATRLWPTSVGAQYILSAYMGGVLLGIAGLRSRGARAVALHVASYALLVLMALTYEMVLPLIALNAVLYLAAAGRSRAVLRRGAGDLVLALCFVAYRALAPVKESNDIVAERTPSEWVDRAGTLLEGAWESWHTLFVTSRLAVVLVILGGAVVVVALATRPAERRPIAAWLGVAGLAVVFALAGVASILPANDYYVLVTTGTFNRLNAAAAPAYCLLFIALLALLFHGLAPWLSRRVALAVVTLLGAVVVVSQVPVARDSQEAWAQSWREQTRAINALARLLPEAGVPRNASIVAFGIPVWERGWVPVFASDWDLRGAIDYSTDIDPPQAYSFIQDQAKCGPAGVTFGGAALIRYRGPSPLWFVNPALWQARPVQSRAQCEQLVATWGHAPFWGTTVTVAR